MDRLRSKGRTDLIGVLKVKIEEQLEVSKAQRGQWLGVHVTNLKER